MLEKGRSFLKDGPDIFNAISEELERQRNGLELIASENFVSRAACRHGVGPDQQVR